MVCQESLESSWFESLLLAAGLLVVVAKAFGWFVGGNESLSEVLAHISQIIIGQLRIADIRSDEVYRYQLELNKKF